MIAFEVSVNGKRVCVAGAERVSSVSLHWAHHSPQRVGFSVGGVSSEGGVDHHCEWDVPPIGVGDEVTIRIVEADAVDRGVHRPRASAD